MRDRAEVIKDCGATINQHKGSTMRQIIKATTSVLAVAKAVGGSRNRVRDVRVLTSSVG